MRKGSARHLYPLSGLEKMRPIGLFCGLIVIQLLICALLSSSASCAEQAKETVSKETPVASPQKDLPTQKAAAGEKAENVKTDAVAPEKEEEEEKAPAPVNQAWQIMWTGQRAMINEIRDTALKLSENFSTQTEALSEHLRPFEEEGRRLLVFTNTFKGHPNAMEAVNRRINATIMELDHVLEPLTQARLEAESLLERVNQMTENLPDDTERSNLSAEMQAYIQDITKARFRLMAALAQYNSLLPSLSLVNKLAQTRDAINAELPKLWKNYYLQKPVPWLNPDEWTNTARDIYYSVQAMLLRLPVELPVTKSQWGTALSRFFISLIFCGVLCILLRRRWMSRNASDISKHIFRVSVPWLVVGLAFLAGAISATGEFFRAFLALGSISVILGQVNLAWDLRQLQAGETRLRRPPFLQLLPLVFCAYTLFYMPITQPLLLAIWVCSVVIAIWRLKKLHPVRGQAMQLEKGSLDCYPIILWICLFLALSGFQIYSIALYLLYVALVIALEICVAGMAIVSRINEHLPKEGAQAVLARLLVALAAPGVLVLAVAGACLWVAILPGGVYLLSQYALRGVTVGATQFNIVQILLIISVFYLTRTVVAMGTRFLAKLPQQGFNFDLTLITPLQTALTYAAWAVFGLFVLRALGMELSNLAMVAGGLSVGIGFGMQTIVNNFFSGLILIFGRTLQVGDVVEVGGVTGRVRKISVRATMVETYDNAIIYVPNSEFMSNRLINWTSFTRSVRREVQVGVAYGSDTSQVIHLLISLASAHENVLKFPAPSVNFADFAASSLDFRLRFWVKDYELGAKTCSDLRLAIDRVFAENHIDIAFPQLDVHLKPEESGQPAARPAVKRMNGSAPRKPVSSARPGIRRPRRPTPTSGQATLKK